MKTRTRNGVGVKNCLQETDSDGFDEWFWLSLPGLLLLCLITTLFPASQALANANYYDDGTGTDVLSSVFENASVTTACSGCHAASNAACTADGATSTAYLGYTGVVACYTRIQQKLSTSPGVGSRMPYTAVYTNNTAYANTLTNWNNKGRPQAPPTTPTTGSVTGKSKTGATLNGTFNTNTSYSQGQYRFLYGTSSPPGTASSVATLNVTSNTAGSRAISSLSCGTLYYYRAQVRNGGSATYTSGSITSFTTSDCTAPVISVSSGSNPVSMDEDASPTAFSLTLQVTNDDPGSHTWAISTPATHGTASASGTGATKAIGYTPDANYTGSDTFTVSATNTTSANNAVGYFVVTVNISAVNDPPVINGGATSIGVGMSEDSSPTPFSLTLTATDVDSTAAEVNWSISSAASHGTASTSGTGYSKAISYTPVADYNGSDSFTVQAASGAATDEIVVNVTISPQPDNPVALDDGPFTFDIGVPLVISVLSNDSDVDGDSLTVTGIRGVAPGAAAVAVNSSTQIQYTSTSNFTADSFAYQAKDNSASGLLSTAATVTVTPRDTDGDGVIDYLDNCPATINADQKDSDGDSGSFVNQNHTTDPAQNIIDAGRIVANSNFGVDSPGGDACDVDDDNDGMHDDYETANSLDPLDPSDAAADNDGDGVSNYDELVNGTNPNLKNLVIDATGYLTPYELTPPDPRTIHSAATAVKANDYGPYRPGDNTITWTPSNSSSADLASSDPGNLVSDPPEQPFLVRPLVNFAADQQAVEGVTANVKITLNGDAPAWTASPSPLPVTVNYSISGTATNPADHDAASGSIDFAPGVYQVTIPVNIVDDSPLLDSGETIVFTIDSVEVNGVTDSSLGAAIGAQSMHTVTIVEGNIAPEGTVTFSQGGPNLATAYADVNGGVVVIDLNPFDANGDALSYDWSLTDGALIPMLPVTTTSTSSALSAGSYLVDVTITDDGSPARSTRLTRVLKVEASAPSLTGADTDGDGSSDSAEGYGDADGDGIPDYLDAQDGTAGAGNLVPDQTEKMSSSHLLESSPGTMLTRGQSASAAGHFGALMTDDDIEQYGGRGGIAPLNATDSYDHATGIYDFEVRGLMPGSQARIVIPLQTGIPKNAVYRKFDPNTGWKDFVVDANNGIASALGDEGACPEPGSALYVSGLRYLYNCIQLTIQDGGPNDNDNAANGVVVDPGTTGIVLSDPETEVVEDGGGRMSPLMLAVLLMLGLAAAARRRGRVAAPPDR